MTERDLQLAVVQHWRSSLVCAAPNYTPLDWWECDVWGVLKSGNWIEWECKISREDLRADAGKMRRKHIQKSGKWEWRDDLKHDAVPAGKGPSRFYFVVPESLGIEEEDVPEWAGLATVREYRGRHWQWAVHVTKTAPSLGSHKATTREIRIAQRRMWYRYWNCLAAMNRKGIAEPEEAEAAG